MISNAILMFFVFITSPFPTLGHGSSPGPGPGPGPGPSPGPGSNLVLVQSRHISGPGLGPGPGKNFWSRHTVMACTMRGLKKYYQ